MSAINLDEIREREAATEPGPWWWGGNVDDHGDVGLRGRGHGYGVVDILRTSTEDIDNAGAGKEWDASDASDYIDRDSYIQWRTENPKSHMCVLREDRLFIEPMRDLAIFEVARNQGLPDETPRTHPQVYRGDVVGVRNANAAFIAHARQDIPDLLAEVTRLTAELAAANAVIATLRDESEFLSQHLAENGGSLKIGRTTYLPDGSRVQLYQMDNPAGFMAALVDGDGEPIERKAHNAAN